MDEYRGRLRDELHDEHAPPDGHRRLMARVRTRERRRRLAAAGLGLVLTGVLGVAGYAALRNVRGTDDFTPPAAGPTASQSSPDPSPSGRLAGSTEPTRVAGHDAPPPVIVRFFDQYVRLGAYSYCYGTVCASGGPPENPLDVGSPDEVTVEFPLPNWSFTAYFRPAGDDCGRVIDTPLTPAGDGTFTLRPVGYADTYDVTLFGRGGGDLSVSFHWTTPVDGPLPEPSARLAVVSNEENVTSYGVELHVENMASTPSSERAIISVRAANGREITFEGAPADRDCLPEGTVYWDGPDAEGMAAARLGEPPFTYEVELILDGVRHFATATWPDDEIRGEEPSVRLDFSPPLPALREH